MKTPPSLVFISYPRNPDIHFVERLAIALHNEHFETWVDSHSIQYGEEFLKAIERGIQRAVAVVYLVSPEAIDSKYCNVELNLALTFGKRIIPILRRPTTDIPAPIEGIHRLEVLKDSELDSKLPDLLSDLQTDQEWERLHNRLLDKALDYKATPKDHRHELLLSSYELDRAQKWRQSADPRDAKRIVPAIRLFLSESRKQVDRNDRDFARIAQALSNEFKFGSRDWDNVTQEISERPWVEHTKILSIVVDDAIRDGGGRLGDHFYYLLGDLPRALKLQKSDWARIIFRIFSNEWFRYSAVPSMIAESTFTFPAFFAACDLAANEGQLIAPVSLPVRIARESLLELPGDFTRENAWIFDKLLGHARSKAVGVTASIPVDAQIEQAQLFALQNYFDALIDPDLFAAREQDMDTAFVLLNDVLSLLDLYYLRSDVLSEFSMKARLQLLGRLAIALARNGHWGTAYRASECLWETPLFEISVSEMLKYSGSYQETKLRQNIGDPQRRQYARRKCFEVLEIMMENGAPLLWPAALSSRLGARSKILHLLKRLRSEDGYPSSERFDAFAEDLLERALEREIPRFGSV